MRKAVTSVKVLCRTKSTTNTTKVRYQYLVEKIHVCWNRIKFVSLIWNNMSKFDIKRSFIFLKVDFLWICYKTYTVWYSWYSNPRSIILYTFPTYTHLPYSGWCKFKSTSKHVALQTTWIMIRITQHVLHRKWFSMLKAPLTSVSPSEGKLLLRILPRSDNKASLVPNF